VNDLSDGYSRATMTQDTQRPTLKVIIHAPTAEAFERARNNASNLKRAAPDADVRIVANAQAVAAALDTAPSDLDALTWVCPNTLSRIGRDNREPLEVLDGPAVIEMARMQQAGWIYIRA
jgi:uncharacterized protein